MFSKMVVMIFAVSATVNAQTWAEQLRQKLGESNSRQESAATNAPAPANQAPLPSRNTNAPVIGQTTPATAANRPTGAWRPNSGLLVDDLNQVAATTNAKTPMSVGSPMPFEQFSQMYGGYNNYGFGNFSNLGGFGFTYPQYASLQSAQQLPAYIQQELQQQCLNSGQFNCLLPATGFGSQQLGVLEAEQKLGRGVDVRDADGKARVVKFGPNDWTSAKYVMVSSVGIVQETINGHEWNGEDIARLASDLGVSKIAKLNSVIWDTLGRSRKTSVNRMVLGVLYVSIIDLETRSVLKTSTGVAAVAYNELSALDVPVFSGRSVTYMGAGKFARELVLSALYDKVNEDKQIQKFLQGRCSDKSRANDPACSSLPGRTPAPAKGSPRSFFQTNAPETTLAASNGGWRTVTAEDYSGSTSLRRR